MLQNSKLHLQFDNIPLNATLNKLTKTPKRVAIREFNIIKPITCGSFGSVYLVQKKISLEYFALKVVKKTNRVKNYLNSEKDIMAQLNSPYIVKLYYTFQSKSNVYFVLEYIPGGDLFSLLRSVNYLSCNDAIQFLADIILSMEFIHLKGIVHRDLKPDNFLIAKNGHLKLTDFGLSTVFNASKKFKVKRHLSPSEDMTPIKLKRICKDSNKPIYVTPKKLNRTPVTFSNMKNFITPSKRFTPYSFNYTSSTLKKKTYSIKIKSILKKKLSCVGSLEYLAPEVIQNLAYGYEADIWSFGIMMFEILSGIVPYSGSSSVEIKHDILNNEINWDLLPEEVDLTALDLLMKILIKDPIKRLSLSDIKKHQFFNSIVWSNHISNKSIFQPDITEFQDISYFDARKTLFPLKLELLNNELLCTPFKKIQFENETPYSENIKDLLNFSFENYPCLHTLNLDK